VPRASFDLECLTRRRVLGETIAISARYHGYGYQQAQTVASEDGLPNLSSIRKTVSTKPSMSTHLHTG
jgi:hypothetical protein